jgi:hypothetical protein
MAPVFIGDPGYVASFWPLNQNRHFPSRFQPEARKSNNPLNLFLSFISTLTLFGNTLAMPLKMPSKCANSPCSAGHCGLTLASTALETPTIRSILTTAPTLKAAPAMAPIISVQASIVLAQVKMSRTIAQGTTVRVSGSFSYRLRSWDD